MRGKLIALTGKKQVGKSTLANELFQYGFAEVSFAAPIREFVAGLLGVHVIELERMKEMPIDWLGGETPRWMMQSLGTEWGRELIHPNIWVAVAARKINRLRDKGIDVVVSDLRFENEATLIHTLGGRIVRVVRGEASGPVDSHISEAGIDDSWVDTTFYNDGPLEDLQAFAERLAATVH